MSLRGYSEILVFVRAAFREYEKQEHSMCFGNV